jgi:excisionase family DNA binding protein
MKKNANMKGKAGQSAQVPRLALSLAEAEERTGVSRYTLRRMIVAGTLKAARFGRRIVIPAAELENLLKPGAVPEAGREKA